MSDPVSQDVTGLLHAWAGGDPVALERLLPAVYSDLKRLARRHLRGERSDLSLQSGDLVNELYLRLASHERASWQSRIQFFAVCSRLVRRILIDHARRRSTAKRTAAAVKVPLEEAVDATVQYDSEILALDEALVELESVDTRKARLVELKFFGGLSILESASALGCSTATVEREWRAARAWLKQRALRRRSRPGT